MKCYLGIDLGGTNLVVGVVDEAGLLLAKESVKTEAPRSPESICDDIVSITDRLLSGLGLQKEDIAWAGFGVPGMIHNDVVITACNLGFYDVPLGKILERRLGIPVFLENDANAAAYGEIAAGAGRGFSSLVILTIGTGIGGGIVLDRKIWRGFNGIGGELGHIVVQARGRVCSCGKSGCLEAYCSATSIKKQTLEAMSRNPTSLMWALSDGVLEKADAQTAFDAMRRGDEAGTKVVEEFIFYLSLGVSNTINLLQPEIFCLGGGVAREGETILTPLRKLVEKQTYMKTEEQRPRITAATLGNDAGLIGASLLGLQQYQNAH